MVRWRQSSWECLPELQFGTSRRRCGQLNVAVFPRRGIYPLPDARKAGVDIVAASSLAAGHLTLVPELKRALGNEGAAHTQIIVGGVIPPQDFDALYAAGASAIFPPGTVIADSAIRMLEVLDGNDGTKTAAE